MKWRAVSVTARDYQAGPVRCKRMAVRRPASYKLRVTSYIMAGGELRQAMKRVSSYGLRVTAVLALASALGSSPVHGGDAPWIARGANGIVATDHALATQAGVEILRAGGNAVDAAVAVSFALGVTRPYSTGPGGGGFMLLYRADGTVIAQDFRETAPSGARADYYARFKAANPSTPNPSEFGLTAAATPGVVAGRCQALAQWGTMPRDRVLAAAIRIAHEGFPVDADHVNHVREALAEYEQHASLKESCAFVYRTYLGSGTPPAVGDILKQPGLGRLLEAIAVQGPDIFYQGDIARAIGRDVSAQGGVLVEGDLSTYEPKTRQALSVRYRDYRVLMMPLPSSGGVAIAQTLGILTQLDYPTVIKRDPIEGMHLQIEAMKHAFADRSRHLGDRDSGSVPQKRMLSEGYAKEIADRIRGGIGLPETYGSRELPDDAGTSNFCVADAMGNVVVSSETINTTFGSLAAIEEWGLVLNNEMDDFTTEPGKPNAFGLIQSARNAVAPGKRPLSSMVPTIVLKNEKPYLALGASGGPRIISSVLNVMLAVLDREMPLQAAIEALRPHHQWQPDTVYFDRPPPPEVASSLAARGHKVSDRKKTGIVNAIMRTPDGWVGAADPRKGGTAAAR